MSQTTDRMSATANEVADRMQDYSTQAKSSAASARDRLADAVEKGSDWASEKSRDLRATSQDLLGSACDAVSARPMVAVGIAAAVGYLLARMLARD